jgi:folate-binding Fe-S cluster repair protein YgfZ
MFFLLATGMVINLWQIVKLEDTGIQGEDQPPRILITLSNDSAIEVEGNDAQAIAEMMMMFSVRTKPAEAKV